MTRGNPLGLILRFSLPLLIGNIFQQLYNLVDTFIVGNMLDVDKLAAVGSTSGFMYLIMGFANGLATGLAIVIAQRFGANDAAGLRQSTLVSLLLAAGVTVALTAISVGLTRPMLVWLRTPVEIIDDAYAYIVVIFWGIFTSMAFNLLSNIMRAVGNSRSPLIFLAIACVLNIILDILFIKLGHGVAGVAAATVVSQGVSALLCFLYIRRCFPMLRIRKEDFKFSARDFKKQAKLGLAIGFQSSIIGIGSLAVQYSLNGLGTTALAGFTTGHKIELFSHLPFLSLGTAMATYTAQNYGAGEMARIKKGTRLGGILAVGASLVMGAVVILFGRQLSALFVGDNPKVLDYAHLHLIISGSMGFFLALLYVFRFTLQGLGNSLVPTIAGIAELVMRCFAALVLSRPLGFVGISLSQPLAWFGACVPLSIAYFFAMRHLPARPTQ